MRPESSTANGEGSRVPAGATGEPTVSELGAWLWQAANILRGPVDAADYKTYIFPLLFFKRISDVYDEERDLALAESDGDLEYASFAENHRFQVPPRAHWGDVRGVSSDVGAALQYALREIERANPNTLYGIFGDAQWTNKERLSDSVLRDLIEHFSARRLANADVSGDLIGRSYEYLIKQFADATNKKAGEFYTPRSVVRLMVNILDPRPGETVYDPACGTGGMLLEAVQHVREADGESAVRRLWGKLYGQEKNLTTAAIARMNLFLHGVEDFQVVRGDTLRQPAFFEGDRLATFDCVIANPPFSLERWGEALWAHDRFGRNRYGIPPSKSGDFAWVQHMLASTAKVTGRLAVVLPHGALFRMGAEGEIRRRILEDDRIEAVIGLAPNLFYGAGLAAAIVIARDDKPAERRGNVLIVDGSRLFRKGRNQNTLEPGHADELLDSYRQYADAPGLARVVSLDEIKANDWNLNIARYVAPPVAESTVTLPEAIDRLERSLAAAYAAEDRLADLLRTAGLMRDIKLSATIADVAATADGVR
ncbi:MAG: SAM-dependent DNA methyltransferase [Chloroflexi bacterium]|nr:SAM-dependent DNA methyltransferase [Chloroflexota bacterium]